MKPPLTPGNLRFVDELLASPTMNATDAYQAAYACSRATAGVEGSRLLKDPRIQAELERRKGERCARVELTQDIVLKQLFQIVTADPRDLIEFRRGACRYCYGEGHLYQMTAREIRDAYKAYLKTPQGKEDSAGFDMQGGDGFNPKRDAHPDCPECFGEGVGYEFVKDTRKLTPAAARLYAGMKVTKDGIEIKTRGQDKLLNLAMQHLGMLNEKTDDGETAEAKAAEIRALVAALGATSGKPDDK